MTSTYGSNTAGVERLIDLAGQLTPDEIRRIAEMYRTVGQDASLGSALRAGYLAGPEWTTARTAAMHAVVDVSVDPAAVDVWDAAVVAGWAAGALAVLARITSVQYQLLSRPWITVMCGATCCPSCDERYRPLGAPVLGDPDSSGEDAE